MATSYLRFDEIEDVLASLDLLALVVPLVNKQPSYWKWVILAAHAALQGAIVSALSDTTGIPVLDKKSTREMLSWLDAQDEAPPEERLADFTELLARCRKASCMDGRPLKLSHLQRNDIRRLHNDFRNNFTHFKPKGWSIEEAGLPRIVRTAVDAIETLMDHPRLQRKLEGNQKRRLASRLKAIRQA
jgi:hypothetical protein